MPGRPGNEGQKGDSAFLALNSTKPEKGQKGERGFPGRIGPKGIQNVLLSTQFLKYIFIFCTYECYQYLNINILCGE